MAPFMQIENAFSVLIPDGESSYTLPVISCLSQIPNIKIHILSSKRWTPSRFSRHIQRFHFHKVTTNHELWLETVQKIAGVENINSILPVDQPAIRVLTKHKISSTSLSITTPLPELKTFDITVDKWRLAQFLQSKNLPAPATIHYKDESQLETDLKKLHFPVLTKPIEGKGGHGIKIWENPSELTNYLRTCRHPEEHIIQSYIKGEFTGCSVLCKDGNILAITMQKGLLPPRYRFCHPEDIRLIHDSNLYELIERLVNTLNWSGVANIDLIQDEQDGSFKILEVNPRYWGTLPGSLNAGVNFPYLACLAGMMIEFELPRYTLIPYLGGVGVFSLFLPYRLRKLKEIISFERSAFKYFLADPLPLLVRWNRKVLKKILSIFN